MGDLSKERRAELRRLHEAATTGEALAQKSDTAELYAVADAIRAEAAKIGGEE